MSVVKEWRRNYRYHGGVFALGKCACGTLGLKWGTTRPPAIPLARQVECITFSVVPRLTALWAALMQRAIPDRDLLITVGDCSGGFRPLEPSKGRVRVLPLLNIQHGEKLDLFLRGVCAAEFVIISDDDVFWLDNFPWDWALRQFQEDPLVAAVSLVPRTRVSSVLEGKVEQPMGSYCLIVRRETWLKECLSFRIVRPPRSEGYDWIYDTADYANVELLHRGYRVVVAPDAVRSHLVVFDGTSSWSLRMQERSGDILKSIRDVPLRQEKALRAIAAIQGLQSVVQAFLPGKPNTELVRDDLLSRSEGICRSLLDNGRIDEIRGEENQKLARLQDHVASLVSGRSLEIENAVSTAF